LTLAVLGVALGLVLAHLGVRAIVGSQAVVIPLIERVELSVTALAATAVVAMLVTVVIGLVPGWHIARQDPLAGLGQSSRGSVGDRGQSIVRSTLVVAEVAIACTLLIGAGLLIRSFGQILDVDLGFDPENRASFQVNAGARYPERADVEEFQRLLVQTLRDLPGVENAALSDNLPLDGNRSWVIRRSDQADDEDAGIGAYIRMISDGYFETMGIPILEGRGFGPDDTTETEQAIVFNETAASMLWPEGNAVGGLALNFLGNLRVIGVVADVRHNSLDEESGAEMYLSTSQFPWETRAVSAVVHTTGEPIAMAGQIRTAVREVDPRIPLTDFRPISRLVDRAVSPRHFLMTMLTGFAGIALILASLGIYGVISYSVRRRRAEIGIRLALGAVPGRVLVQEIRRGVGMAGVGVILGLTGALFVSRLMAAQLYGVGATDPTTYFGMTLTLMGVALLAGYLPARRAARINPVTALRDE
jgi:predicted permease